MDVKKIKIQPILTVFFSDRAVGGGCLSGGSKIGLWDEMSLVACFGDDSIMVSFLLLVAGDGGRECCELL